MSAMYMLASASDKRLCVIGIVMHENPAQSGCALVAARHNSSTSGSGQQCASVKNRYFPRAFAAPTEHGSISYEGFEHFTQSAGSPVNRANSRKSGGTTTIISYADLSTVSAFPPCQHRSHWPRRNSSGI